MLVADDGLSRGDLDDNDLSTSHGRAPRLEPEEIEPSGRHDRRARAS